MSFYGGKQGRTYHLVEHFDTIQDMLDAFEQGGQYTDVNYGQYVIIDTKTKKDPSNGIIYRRGFDYQAAGASTVSPSDWQKDNQNFQNYIKDPGRGAIYVGQVVGPQGSAPNMTINSESVAATASTTGITLASTVTEDEHTNVTDVNFLFSIPKLEINPVLTQASTSAYSTPGVVENNSSTAYPYKYDLDFTIPIGKHGQDLTDLQYEEIQQANYEKSYLRPIYTNYNTTSTGSTIAGSTIPYRNIKNIASSTIAADSYAQNMVINYTNILPGATDLSSTFIPTQINDIVTSTATPNQFTINLRTNDSIVPKSITIPSANLNIAGTVATTADLPSSADPGTIMEAASRLYLYQDNEWVQIFSQLFNNLEQPTKYIQVDTTASTLLAIDGIYLPFTTKNYYWEV